MRVKFAICISVIAVVLIEFFAPSTALAKEFYEPLYRGVDRAEVIVTGRIVRVEDPAYDELQKPLSERYYIHGTVDNAKATGYLKVEEVMKGTAKEGEELRIECPSAAPTPEWIEDRKPTWKVGDEGIWCLVRVGNGRWGGGPCKRSLGESIAAILKVRENKATLNKYLYCANIKTWADLFEMVTCDGQFGEETLLRWFARLPAVARADKACPLRDIHLSFKFDEKVSRLSDSKALFLSFALFSAAEEYLKKADGLKGASPRQDAGIKAARFAREGAEILCEKLKVLKDDYLDGTLCYYRPARDRCRICRLFFQCAMKVMLGSDKFDKRNSQKLSRLFDQLGSENWYVREHAQISIARMLEEDYNHTLKNMLQKYCCSGDLEQKYRVEQLLPLAPDNSRLIRVRLKPLANLALLLHGEQGVRSKAAERLKGRVKVAESLISASLETRTEFVLKALDKLYPTEKNNRENTEK